MTACRPDQAALWALASTQYLESAGARDGVVATLGSVAGDRGRNANFIYGAGKAGLATLMQGLAHRAALTGGPRAIIFKLGFVDTPMTAGFKKGGPLWAKPEAIAEVMCAGCSDARPLSTRLGFGATSSWPFAFCRNRLSAA